MVSEREYLTNEEGVHLLLPDNCTRYTLCGLEYDPAEPGALTPTKLRVVTCHSCCDVVIHCRGVLIDTTVTPQTSKRRRKKSK